MSPNQFRNLALRLPGVVEQSHMCHPDFRVGGKIFATLFPDEAHGMVRLSVANQAEFVRTLPAIFQPVKGAWGRSGCTQVTLKGAKQAEVLPALVAAWRHIAPKRMQDELDA